MKVRRAAICTLMPLVIVLAAFGLETADSFQGAIAPHGDLSDTQQGMQILTRGPVHEAFAETVTFNPEPGIVVSQAPPDIIEELPPDQRPDGANVSWIPGYWAWDDERNNYLWVSGIWRDLPPGRQWTPGYWGQSGQSFQWTSGYWADAAETETEYLPQPPVSLEVGPNIAAPATNLGWVPGSWIWQSGRYAWRPGYWAAGRPDWDWVPAHYTWAPRGYVFSDGYWDHSIDRRGVLFAPVYFDSPAYSRPDFRYSPSIVINLSVFANQLFLRPRYQHYYFGDYYAPAYQTAGYYSPFAANSNRFGYDPIFAHQRWEHRNDRDWQQRNETAFTQRRDHDEARPVRTLAAMRDLLSKGVAPDDQRLSFAAPLAQFIKRVGGPQRFQPLAQDERLKLAQLGQQIQQYRGERQKMDRKVLVAPSKPSQPIEQPKTIPSGNVAVAAKPADRPAPQMVPPVAAPVRLKAPRSPIVAKPADKLTKEQAPPKRHQVPKIDPKAPEPKRPAAADEVVKVLKQPPAPEQLTPKSKEPQKANPKDRP